MKEYTIYITQKKNLPDPEAAGLERTLSSLRPGEKIRAGIYMVYKIKTSAGAEKVRKICDKLLSDPVTQEYYMETGDSSAVYIVDVFLKKGVTDPAGETVLLGIRDLGIRDRFYIATGKRYSLSGATRKEAFDVAGRFLANPVINEYYVS